MMQMKRVSNQQDVDGNLVGLLQNPLSEFGVNLSAMADAYVRVAFDSKIVSVFASLSSRLEVQRHRFDNDNESVTNVDRFVQSPTSSKVSIQRTKESNAWSLNPKNSLAKGGFGTDYRGNLKNREVAVKRISENSRQGKQEFITEVAIIGGVKKLRRDVKSSNIMLDSKFESKLGDFELARTIRRTEQTHGWTREIAGTRGFMGPEIFLTSRATFETDVYAFGVTVVEVA
ncbi:putative L-type lectin-domain containing receptor kinase S.5 [Cucumis melo var. makuwa]|uniref:L-type lectin-domain containing receptor kinase S.5 n=1 Tax=Cucumis melo var. makuwa TaxID=1194695 RepID=A0A5D3DP11_CUCMM|nr:putative L-type lectin-domain containing receptor kinase S.5 [Cucumis melo var. makuwa]TYK25386.1 putative L-type lectin-domain containing receptor kinase S.5 [Cucumis melo var. makuwa]